MNLKLFGPPHKKWVCSQGNLMLEKERQNNTVLICTLFSFFFFFFFFCCTHGMWKFLDQGLNLCCSCNLHYSCSNGGFLICCATWECPTVTSLIVSQIAEQHWPEQRTTLCTLFLRVARKKCFRREAMNWIGMAYTPYTIHSHSSSSYFPFMEHNSQAQKS